MADSYLSQIASLPLYQQAMNKQKELEQQRLDLLTKANAKNSLTPQQALTSGVASVLPMIAGLMIAGKRGAVLGSEVGGNTAASMVKNYQDQQGQEAAQAKAKAELLQEESKRLGGLTDSLQKSAYSADLGSSRDMNKLEFQRETQRMYGNKGTNVTIQNTPADKYVPSKKLVEEASARSALQTSLTSLVDRIMTTPELSPLLDEKPATREDGSIDLSATFDLLARKLSEKSGLAANTVSSAARAEIGKAIGEFLKALSGTAVSETERAEVNKIITGDGVLPADWGTALGYIARFAESDRRSLIDKMHAEYRLQQNMLPDDQESVNYRERLERQFPKFSPTGSSGLGYPKAMNAVEGVKAVLSDAGEEVQVSIGADGIQRVPGTNIFFNPQTKKWELEDAAK